MKKDVENSVKKNAYNLRGKMMPSLYDVESDEEIEKFTHALIDIEE